jgi:hypothetical protein
MTTPYGLDPTTTRCWVVSTVAVQEVAPVVEVATACRDGEDWHTFAPDEGPHSGPSPGPGAGRSR